VIAQLISAARMGARGWIGLKPHQLCPQGRRSAAQTRRLRRCGCASMSSLFSWWPGRGLQVGKNTFAHGSPAFQSIRDDPDNRVRNALDLTFLDRDRPLRAAINHGLRGRHLALLM